MVTTSKHDYLTFLGSISVISVVVVGFLRFIKDPIKGLIYAGKDTLQSSLFLSSLVASYQAVVCAFRSFVNYSFDTLIYFFLDKC